VTAATILCAVLVFVASAYQLSYGNAGAAAGLAALAGAMVLTLE
jgi:hypothetical protein